MASVKNPRVLSVFYGEESYLLDRELRLALKWPGRLITGLDGASASEDAVVSALEDMPMDDEQGIAVVVDNAEKIKLKGPLLNFFVERDPKDKSAIFIAICRTAKLSKGWLDLGQQGAMIEHPKLKPWEKNKVKDRASKEASLVGLTIDEPAFDTLFALHGEQTNLIANEIRKMAVLLGKGQSITKDLVLSLCSLHATIAPWDVSEAVFAKDSRRALRLVSRLYERAGDEILIPIVASLMKQLEQVLVMRSMLDQQLSPDAIGAALGIHSFRVQKELPVVRKHEVSKLIPHMKKLCELETHVKGAAPSKRALVELAVLSLAA